MQKLVVFSGAGMSAESGIQTFRDGDGLWEQHRVEDVATPTAWAKNPELVQRFYNARRKNILQAQPNAAHRVIAQLQQYFAVQVITQNIDDLHERAGSRQVLHLHGNIRFARSSAPNANPNMLYPIQGDHLDLQRDLCPQGYPLRPHVVWFGEDVPAYSEAEHMVQQADIFVVIGTSLKVYPVAGLIHHVNPNAQAYYIDPNAQAQHLPTQYKKIALSATQGLSQLVEQLIQGAT